MSLKRNAWALAALLGAGVVTQAGAQAVYKCGPRSYSQMPCSKSIVNTSQAPVPAAATVRDVDAKRLARNRAVARSLRRLPGETDAELAKRRRRAGMLESDRDECARIETRVPVEKMRMANPDPNEMASGQAGLAQSRKRFSELHC